MILVLTGFLSLWASLFEKDVLMITLRSVTVFRKFTCGFNWLALTSIGSCPHNVGSAMSTTMASVAQKEYFSANTTDKGSPTRSSMAAFIKSKKKFGTGGQQCFSEISGIGFVDFSVRAWDFHSEPTFKRCLLYWGSRFIDFFERR